jgi:hypothetical protein
LREGKENLRECLRAAFGAAQRHNIGTLVVFTGEGLGIKVALDEFCTDVANSRVRLVAVTFPAGKAFTDAAGNPILVEIPATLRAEMQAKGIPLVRAHLPFDPISPMFSSRGVLGQDLSLVESALNVFGGSMSLCVQAVLMACDAGELVPGDHTIALTSDTAILAQAAPTANMLRGLAVREILCKPAIYSIGRGESVEQLTMPLGLSEPKPVQGQVLLPERNEKD